MMTATVAVTCVDFLRNNSHFYAFKAKRRKISLIAVEVVNRSDAELRLAFGTAELITDRERGRVESRERIVRKLTEFTWDFFVYMVIDFHPLLAIGDLFFFLFGPIYNRRLRKQLRELSDSEEVLKPGESRRFLLGFLGVPKGERKLQFSYTSLGAAQELVECTVG